MSWIHMIPLAAVCSIPITFGVLALVRLVMGIKLDVKHWPPNYWW